MNDRIENTLESFGLNQKEISIYLALLSIGTASASVLSNKTDLPRSTAQFVSKELVKKGLFRSVKQGITFQYTVEPPDKFMVLLNEQESKIKNKQDNLNQILGDLKSIMNPHATMPKVQYFEGIHGIMTAFQDIIHNLNYGDELLSFTKTLDGNNRLKDTAFIREFITKRIDKKIKTRVIATNSEESRLLKNSDSSEFRETKIVEDLLFDFDGGEFFLFNNRIFTMTLENNTLFGFSVHSPSIYKMYKGLFEVAWAKTQAAKE